MRPSSQAPRTPEALACEEHVCRLSDLLPAGATDRELWDGWVVEPFVSAESVEASVAVMAARLEKIGAAEARARVAPHLEDAFGALVAYGLPYLEESLAAMGGGRGAAGSRGWIGRCAYGCSVARGAMAALPGRGCGRRQGYVA